MNIANQKPVLLSSQFSPNAGNVYDPKADIDKILIDPLFEPLNAAAPVDIQDDQNNTVTKDDIYNHVLNCTSDIMNASSEDWLCKLYRASMIYVPQNEPFSFRELFAVQAGIKEKCRFPVTVCVTHPLTSPKAQNCSSAVMVLLRTYLRISHSHYGCLCWDFIVRRIRSTKTSKLSLRPSIPYCPPRCRPT